LKDYKVQANDGGTCINIVTVYGNVAAEREHVFSEINTDKIRLYVIKSKDIAARVYEIEAYRKYTPTAVISNLAPLASLSVDSELDSNYTKDKAVYGIKDHNASRWISANTDEPHYIELDWGTYKTISNVKVWSGAKNAEGWQINNYEIQYWTGDEWETIATVTNNTQDGYYDQFNDLTFDEVTTTKVRMYVTDGTTKGGYKNCRLFEIEVYGY